jgi:hypothetical protein
MKYRIVARAEDGTGITSEVELIPAVSSQSGWRCSHAVWPDWMKDEQSTECSWCREPLIACEFVECPWCERYVTTEAILAHWQSWCDDEPEADASGSGSTALG